MANRWILLTDTDMDYIQTFLRADELLYKKLKRARKTIKVSSRKGKGKNLQYQICERISEIIGIKYEQFNDACEIHSREMGQHGLDVILRGKAAELFPYAIECKNSESLDIMKAINQVKANQKKDMDWLIMHKRKALSSPIAIMDSEAFFKLVKQSR